LIHLFLKGEYRVTQRAGGPLSYIAISHPRLIQKHLKNLFQNLQKQNLHNAVVRNTFRLMQYVEIPKSLQGLATDTCFRFLNDRKQPMPSGAFQ